MKLDVVLLPSLWEGSSREVCIAVDVLRASSSVVAMMGAGADAILVTASVEEARRLARDLPDHLLCGGACRRRDFTSATRPASSRLST